MQTIDGRKYASRIDLVEHTGYSRDPLVRLWRDREENGHPEPRKINGVMHWDLEEWDRWFADHNRRRRDARQGRGRAEPRPLDRSGDPDEELPPAGQARVLGIDVSAISHYRRTPPPGWPEPVREEELPSGRTREFRTRRQLWEYHDKLTRAGVAGRPPAGGPEGPDPRVQEAIQALSAQPGRAAGQIAAELAERHGQSVAHWKTIVTEARKRID
ncbi:hypothetical protein ACFYWP_37100 [Actinacidiphila glaucinigra]|uniref:hypothetical protein n=1 Tax=Actinacidiphila glaucinigra TaxID=235986 RepID=UPI0036A1F5EA